MIWHGVVRKAAPKVVPHLVAFAAYEALHQAVTKVPWREATVSAMACGVRGVRKAEKSTERARLTAADMFAEAIERSGEVPPSAAEEEVPPSAVAEEKAPPRRRRTTETSDH